MQNIDFFCMDQLMYRIVSRLVDDAMSTSARPTLSGETLGELTPIIPWLSQRGFFEAARQAMIYARMYGGGGVVCFIDDGRCSDQPVDILNIKGVRGFYALPKQYLTPLDTGSGEIDSAWFGPQIGRPSMYLVTPSGGVGANQPANVPGSLASELSHGNRFHRSRIIPWMYRDDLDLRQARRWANWGGWGPGVVECCLPAYLNRRSGALRIADLLNSCVMNVMKLNGVSTMMSTPSGGSPLRNALDWVKACLRYTGDGLPLIAIDDTASLEAKGHNLSGIDKLVGEQRGFLLDTLEYPEVVIFGQGGNNGLSGDSNEGQWRSYFNTVKSLQEGWIWTAGAFGGGVRQACMLAMACKSGPTRGVTDPTVKATWPSLWIESEKDKAETRLKNAQARASDSIVLGIEGKALARLDPTVQQTYPALDVDDDPLPDLSDLDKVPASPDELKAAATPGASLTAAAAEKTGEDTAQVDASDPSITDPPTPAMLPDDISTERELAAALRMTKPAFRRWLDSTNVTTYPMPPGTRGGHRYSLKEVLGAWQKGAIARADAVRVPVKTS